METCTTKFMHMLNMRFAFHSYILRLASWIWTNASTEKLKFESPFKMKLIWGLHSWTLVMALGLVCDVVLIRADPSPARKTNSISCLIWQEMSKTPGGQQDKKLFAQENFGCGQRHGNQVERRKKKHRLSYVIFGYGGPENKTKNKKWRWGGGEGRVWPGTPA